MANSKKKLTKKSPAKKDAGKKKTDKKGRASTKKLGADGQPSGPGKSDPPDPPTGGSGQ